MSYRSAVEIALVLILLLSGIFLRSLKLGDIAPHKADEVNWILTGSSFLKDGKPSGWSLFSHPETIKHVLVFDKTNYTVITPFLAHPPIFSLLIGGWTLATHQFTHSAANWGIIRLPLLITASLTLYFTYALMRDGFKDQNLALFTLATFAFFPSHVIASRFIDAENFLALLLIASVYLFHIYDSYQIPRWQHRLVAVVLLVSSFSAPLMKYSGLVIPATIIFLTLHKKRYRLTMATIITLILSISTLLGFFYSQNWSVAMADLQAHGQRAQSLTHYWTYFTKLDIGHMPLFDPTVIIGLIGAIALAAGKHPARHLITAPLLMIALISVFVAPVEAYGWYKLTIYPFIAIGFGFIIYRTFSGYFAWYILLLPLIGTLLENAQLFSTNLLIPKAIILSLGATITLPYLLLRKKKHSRIFMQCCALASLGIIFYAQTAWILRILLKY